MACQLLQQVRLLLELPQQQGTAQGLMPLVLPPCLLLWPLPLPLLLLHLWHPVQSRWQLLPLQLQAWLLLLQQRQGNPAATGAAAVHLGHSSSASAAAAAAPATAAAAATQHAPVAQSTPRACHPASLGTVPSTACGPATDTPQHPPTEAHTDPEAASHCSANCSKKLAARPVEDPPQREAQVEDPLQLLPLPLLPQHAVTPPAAAAGACSGPQHHHQGQG